MYSFCKVSSGMPNTVLRRLLTVISINGYGRADYVYVEPNTAHGYVVYNVCP